MPSKELQKILYVEDEADIRTVGEMALQLGNFVIKSCSSGIEALNTAGDFKPDLVILDVMMPQMDGPATLKALQNNLDTKNIPVVFMTAKAQTKEIEDYKKMGAIDVIPKPFDPMTLSDHLKKIWKTIP